MVLKLVNLIKFFLLFLSCFLIFNVKSYSLDINRDFSLDVKGGIQIDYIFWNGNKHDEFIYGAYLKSIDFFLNGIFINNKANYFLHFNVNSYSFYDFLSQFYLSIFSDYFRIKFGKYYLPFGIEQSGSLYDKSFLENALLNGMGDGEFFGFSFDFIGDNFSFYSSFAIPDLNYFFNKNTCFKYIFYIRTVSNFFRTDDFVLHFGFDYKRVSEDQKYFLKDTTIIPYKDTPSLKTKSSLLNSYNGVILSSSMFDFEFAFMWKSLFFQTEFSFVDVSWRDFDREMYSSFYFQFSYLFNNVNHVYNYINGVFCNPVYYSEYGAVELLFKYIVVNMINYGPLLMGYCQNDGRKESLLFGVNWFINDKLKIQLNLVIDEFMYCKSPGFQFTGVGLRFQFLY